MIIPPRHILVIDDDLILQSYLEINLTKEGHKVSQLTQGEETNKVLQQQTIDLIILDVMLTGRDGFYWLEWLHLHHPEIDILMLTAKSNDKDRIQGLELGALDYLPKPFHIKELIIRVANILQRSPSNPHKLNKRKIDKKITIEFGKYHFDTQLNSLSKQGNLLNLTHCEAELLSVLCQHPDQIVTRDQLSQALSGQDHSPLDRRIDVHINRLRNKIEETPSSPIYIRTVWGKGYQFYAPEAH